MAKKREDPKTLQEETGQSGAEPIGAPTPAPIKTTQAKRKRVPTASTKVQGSTSKVAKAQPQQRRKPPTALGSVRKKQLLGGVTASAPPAPQNSVKVELQESPYTSRSPAQLKNEPSANLSNLPAAPPNILNPAPNPFMVTEPNPTAINLTKFVVQNSPEFRNHFGSSEMWTSDHFDELATMMWQTTVANNPDGLSQISGYTALYPYVKLQVFASLNWIPSWCWFREQAVYFIKNQGRGVDDKRCGTQIEEAWNQVKKMNTERLRAHEEMKRMT